VKDSICKDFQQSVSELLIRHKSILDIMTKLEEAQARVNRAIAKAVTNCGCIKVNARKQIVPLDINIEDLKNHMSAHIEGELCENCRDIIEKEIGNHLFYIASLCNTLDISLDNVLEKEYENINTLGIYNMF